MRQVDISLSRRLCGLLIISTAAVGFDRAKVYRHCEFWDFGFSLLVFSFFFFFVAFACVDSVWH